jgi:hypothetical protein
MWLWLNVGGVLRSALPLFRFRLVVKGRSVAIGSADFGNVTDVLFDECTIGDDEGSSPWAFKIKMHLNMNHHVSGVTVRNTRFGKISANTWQDPKPVFLKRFSAFLQVSDVLALFSRSPRLPLPCGCGYQHQRY